MNDDSKMDIYRVLKDYRSKEQEVASGPLSNSATPAVFSEIPDIFFDRILVDYHLTRVEVLVLMYIYRRVWCRPNLFQIHGISQMMSLAQMGETLNLEMQEIHLAVRKLEQYDLVRTIRPGQYFVRKYFESKYDEIFGQNYDDFEV